MEGMSGDFNTTKPACCTCGLRTSPTPSSASNTRSAATMLALMFAAWERSSSTEASVLSLSETPPMRSAAFSRSASQRAASSVAPRSDSTYTEAPDTARLRMESAWMETNRSAFAFRARSAASDGAWVLPSVAGIYCDDHIAIALGGCMHRLHRFGRRCLRACRERSNSAEINDQLRPRFTINPNSVHRQLGFELQHDTQCPFGP